MKNFKNKKTAIAAFAAVCVISSAVAVSALPKDAGSGESVAPAPVSLFTAENGVSVQGNVAAPKNAVSGFYEDGSKDGKKLMKYKTAEDIPAYRQNGVLVTSTTEKNRLVFNNEIDLTGKTRNDELVCFQPISSNPGVNCDFSGMKIYLTDVNDENNYICVNVYSSGTYTYMTVETANIEARAYRYGEYHDVKNVTSLWWNVYENNTILYFYGYCSYNRINYGDFNYVMEDPERQIDGGIPRAEMYLAPITLQYDEADKAIWYGNNCLLDLDHPESVGVGKEFAGFSSNRVKLSVSTYNISASRAQYMLYAVDGQGLNGETVQDSTKPYFIENLPAGDALPEAGVGRAYPLFDVNAYDLVDGALPSEIDFKKEGEAAFTPTDGKTFVPQSAGNYTLRYKTKDSSGNVAETEYKVRARIGVEDISIETEAQKTEYFAGEKIMLPEFTARGGSGVLKTKVQAIRTADGAEMPVVKGGFQPTIAGEYDVIISAEDYLGYTGRKTITYKVSVSDAPVFEKEKPMYERFVSGVATRLPALAAYDYSVTGQKRNVITEITVRGTGEYATVSEKIENYIFMPSLEKFGKNIEIEYKAYCKGKSETPVIRVYNAQIVQPEQAYEYLSYNDQALSAETNRDGEAEKYTRFTAKKAGDHSVKFIYPMLLNGFEGQLNAGSAAFSGSAELRFTDTENSENRFSFYFSRGGKNTTKIEYNGTTYEIAGAFESAKVLIAVRGGAVYDTLGNKLFEIEEMFESPTAWVSVVLHTKNIGDSICLKKLGTTLLSATYRRGALRKFRDNVLPDIVLDGKLPMEGDYGETIVVPAAKAYDNLTSVLHVYVTVTAPDGTVLINNAAADKAYTITLLKYGRYEVAYTAADAAGNVANNSTEVALYDKNAPVIDYSGTQKIVKKAGETIRLTKYEAYDAVDESVRYRIFLIDTDGKMKEKEVDSEIVFEEKGRYVIRHIAYDSAGNYAILDIAVTVE